jgi:hypothetical protein
MSKKKSLAWKRKTTGHISTGVLNYRNLVLTGQGTRGPLSDRPWRRRNKGKELARALDAERQAREQDVNWDFVKMCLDHGGLTLEDAKQKARVMEQHLEIT